MSWRRGKSDLSSRGLFPWVGGQLVEPPTLPLGGRATCRAADSFPGWEDNLSSRGLFPWVGGQLVEPRTLPLSGRTTCRAADSPPACRLFGRARKGLHTGQLRLQTRGDVCGWEIGGRGGFVEPRHRATKAANARRRVWATRRPKSCTRHASPQVVPPTRVAPRDTRT